MKIRNYALMLAVSAMAAVSCNIINKFDVDVPKVIDDTQSVSSSKLFDINSGKNFSTDESGNLMLGYNADEKISKKVELNSSADTKIGDLVFSVPDAPTVVEKAASTDGQIILIIDNPSPEKMTVSGTIEAAPVTKASSKIKFNAIVPGNAKSYKIIIKDPIATPAKPADVVASVDEGSVKDALKGTCYASPIRVDLSGKLIVTKAAETKAENVTISADATLLFPVTIIKGTTIKITKSFIDLGLDLSKYSLKASKYDVKCSVTNSLPFTITAAGQSAQGVSAELSTPIVAGSKTSPKTTDITVSVTDNSTNHLVNEAEICLLLTAQEDNIKLNADNGLSIYYDSVLFHKF